MHASLNGIESLLFPESLKPSGPDGLGNSISHRGGV